MDLFRRALLGDDESSELCIELSLALICGACYTNIADHQSTLDHTSEGNGPYLFDV